MSFRISDPWFFSSINGGKITPPTEAVAAAGSGELDTKQRSITIGEPVPIVFAKRVNNKGGILISPGATEARFENNATTGSVTAYYHLALSEGVLDGIPVKDVFQRSCRAGEHTQTYSRRAGTWAPGNFITRSNVYSEANKPEASQFCGSIGLYPGITTLSYNVEIPHPSDQWNRQVHLFIRGGMHVKRLIDGITGPSNNFADLIKWILENTRRIPSALIDDEALLASARFLDVNGLNCDIWIENSSNYEELLRKLASYFLLQPTRKSGKRGLRPLLPTNTNGSIDTSPVNWVYEFTESFIIPDSFELEYTSLADRLPFVAQMIWRQQPDDDIGIVRTAEVSIDGTAINGPYETHDLSAFCTNEDHAVKVGAYILSSRINSTHSIKFSAKPQAHTSIVSQGSIVRVNLQRHASGFSQSELDYLYRVVNIRKLANGAVDYECVHFPVDANGRSVVALDVASAVGAGYEIATVRTGVSCDAPRSGGGGGGGGGRKKDSTVPEEEATEAGSEDDPSTWTPEYTWLIDGVEIPGETGETYTPTIDDVGSEIEQVVTYPDDTIVASDPVLISEEDVGTPIDLINAEPAGTDSSTLGGAAVALPATPAGNDSIGGAAIDEEGGGGKGIDEGEGQLENNAIDDGLDLQELNIPEVDTIEAGPAAGQPLSAKAPCSGSTYQWLRDGEPIAGATSATYTPTGEDIGKEIKASGVCPDGTKWGTKPVVPFNPELDFTEWGPVSGTLTVSYKLVSSSVRYKGSLGQSPVCDISSITSSESSNTLTFSISNRTKIKAATSGVNSGQYLSPAISYVLTECPGQSKTVRRNGVIITTQANGTSGHFAVWGGNTNTTTYVGIISSHYTVITGFVLSASVPGLGSAGQDVLTKGLGKFIDPSVPRDIGTAFTSAESLPW
jgi:hypothetical protein